MRLVHASWAKHPYAVMAVLSQVTLVWFKGKMCRSLRSELWFYLVGRRAGALLMEETRNEDFLFGEPNEMRFKMQIALRFMYKQCSGQVIFLYHVS